MRSVCACLIATAKALREVGMKRRDFIALSGIAAVLPLTVRAQERVRRIGILMPFPNSDSQGRAAVDAFRQQLQLLGWRIGENVLVDERWGVEIERIKADAMALIESQPDVILVRAPRALFVLQRETCKIPMYLLQ